MAHGSEKGPWWLDFFDEALPRLSVDVAFLLGHVLAREFGRLEYYTREDPAQVRREVLAVLRRAIARRAPQKTGAHTYRTLTTALGHCMRGDITLDAQVIIEIVYSALNPKA